MVVTSTGTSKLTYLKPKNVGFPAQKFAIFSLWVWELEKRETISATLASRPSAERLAPLRLKNDILSILVVVEIGTKSYKRF